MIISTVLEIIKFLLLGEWVDWQNYKTTVHSKLAVEFDKPEYQSHILQMQFHWTIAVKFVVKVQRIFWFEYFAFDIVVDWGMSFYQQY